MSKQVQKCVDYIPEMQVISNDSDLEATKSLFKKQTHEENLKNRFAVTPVDWRSIFIIYNL